jgi:hypothetical protein
VGFTFSSLFRFLGSSFLQYLLVARHHLCIEDSKGKKILRNSCPEDVQWWGFRGHITNKLITEHLRRFWCDRESTGGKGEVGEGGSQGGLHALPKGRIKYPKGYLEEETPKQ